MTRKQHVRGARIARIRRARCCSTKYGNRDMTELKHIILMKLPTLMSQLLRLKWKDAAHVTEGVLGELEALEAVRRQLNIDQPVQ